MTMKPFRVALTTDFWGSDGHPRYRDLGLNILAEHSAIHCQPFSQHSAEIDVGQLDGFQGVIVLTPRVSARSVARSHDLLFISRFGVGYDGVDVPACTAADVVVLIAAGAVDRSVAESTVTWMLALTHEVRVKDRLLREGRWEQRSQFMGRELRDRVLGVIGLGGIGRALVKLLSGFGMRAPLAFDPFVTPDVAQSIGVRAVGLEELLTTADFVSIHCPLTDRTRNLIGSREIGLMKSDSYLINTARGGIVDEDALALALKERRIAGAAVDCFLREPVTTPHPLGDLDNVLLAPHSIAWTDELFRDIGQTACRGIVDLAQGRRPPGVVNPEVFERPGFLQKWKRLTTDGVP